MIIEDLVEGNLTVEKLMQLIDVIKELPGHWETEPFNQKLTGVQEYASFLEYVGKFPDKLTAYKEKLAQELEDLFYVDGGKLSTILGKLRIFKNLVSPYTGKPATTYYGTTYGTTYAGSYAGVQNYWQSQEDNDDQYISMMYH